jgi:hypothetical protein
MRQCTSAPAAASVSAARKIHHPGKMPEPGPAPGQHRPVRRAGGRGARRQHEAQDQADRAETYSPPQILPHKIPKSTDRHRAGPVRPLRRDVRPRRPVRPDYRHS